MDQGQEAFTMSTQSIYLTAMATIDVLLLNENGIFDVGILLKIEENAFIANSIV